MRGWAAMPALLDISNICFGAVNAPTTAGFHTSVEKMLDPPSTSPCRLLHLHPFSYLALLEPHELFQLHVRNEPLVRPLVDRGGLDAQQLGDFDVPVRIVLRRTLYKSVLQFTYESIHILLGCPKIGNTSSQHWDATL